LNTGSVLRKVLHRHWLIAALLVAGLVLRVLSQIAYRPALLYIDTVKYLFDSWPGADPAGYEAPLRFIVLIGNLTTVVAVQHALGLAMGAALYVLLVRRGSRRWIAAMGAAPVLLDAYQVQMEQTIMPDACFEALIVAGLVLLLWRPKPTPPMIVAAGLVLGASATVRQVGEILLLPAFILVLLVTGNWRQRINHAAVLCVAFAAPILLYCGLSYFLAGRFWLSHSGITTMYGRMAASADCARLKIPADERSLCPTPWQKALGPDNLLHGRHSPLWHQHLPSTGFTRLVISFNMHVLEQQPLNVLSATIRDTGKLFALTRQTRPGDTPISRWQFQTSYPTLRGIALTGGHFIVLGPLPDPAHDGIIFKPLPRSLGGKADVSRPIAAILRSYQLHGGYTPGPLLAFAALAGLIGTSGIARGGPVSSAERGCALASLLMFTMALGLLLTADLFEFSWRYQLPALITLAPAGALGSAAILTSIGRRRNTAGGNSARSRRQATSA
jgi:hypothetical protein